MPKPPKDLRQFQSLVELVATLRGPEGCPWDKEQTHQTLTPYALEEVAELVEAIESGNATQTKDELGDVLFQVVLHAQLAAEEYRFKIEDVLENLNQKMIRRHPHVFADTKVDGAAEVLKNWDQIKATEHKENPKPVDRLDVPLALPALQRAAKIGSRTKKLKFDWSTAEEVMEKVREEMAELEEALAEGTDDEIFHEIGDMLFSLAQLSRHLEKDPEQVLREANRRFEGRFQGMLNMAREQGLNWMELVPEAREDLWAQVKAQE